MEVIVYKSGKPISPGKRYDLKGVEELAPDAKLSISKRLEKLVRG
jgi:hypothetical protein